MTIFSPQSVGRTDTRKSIFSTLAEFQLDTSVLREAALGDVELAHDLETRCDRVLELERRGHLLDEDAVDAVTNAELLLVRLDVNIARALLDRVEQDHVHEPDDGRVLARFFELEGVHVLFLAGELDLRLVEAGHDLVVRGAAL